MSRRSVASCEPFNALILAAGQGTRLQPLTSSIPKPLLKVGVKTMLELAIDRVIEAGAEVVGVNVSYLGEQIIDFLASRSWKTKVVVSDERDFLLDTGGGIAQAARILGEDKPLLIHNGDIVTNFPVAHLVTHLQGDATLLLQPRASSRYLLLDYRKRLMTRSNMGLAFNGIHVLSPAGLRKLREYAKDQPKAFSIINFYLHPTTHAVGYVCPNPYLWIDAGRLDTLLLARTLSPLVTS